MDLDDRNGPRWFIYGGSSGGTTSGIHARASGRGTSTHCRVRRRNRRFGRVFGCGGGGASAAAKTSGLGYYDESPAEVLEAAWREATLQPRSW